MARLRILTTILIAGLATASPAAAVDCVIGEDMRNRITRHEGIRRCVYEDQYGNPTIGVGHKLHKPVPADLCWGIAKIAAVLALDIEHARGNAIHDLGEEAWSRTPPAQQDVLTEMAFQLGGTGLMRFKKMLAAVRSADFETASEELLDSRLARQTPKRAKELACLMRFQDLDG